MTYYPIERSTTKRIGTTSLRTRNKPSRLYESNEELDMPYWTFEEFMCNKLSLYLKDLDQLKNGLTEISKSLVFEFPILNPNLKRRSIQHVPLNHSLAQLSKKNHQPNNHPINKMHSTFHKAKKEQPIKQPIKPKVTRNTPEISQKKSWLLLDLVKEKSPKVVSRYKEGLHLTNYKSRANGCSSKVRRRMHMKLKKSPYELIPKHLKELEKSHTAIKHQEAGRSSVTQNKSRLYYSFNNKFY